MTFFDIYYAYLEGCAEFNQQQCVEKGWEWHHTLPQSLYGDQPFGLWLTREQHSIASAYQTLAFQTCCVFGWDLNRLPKQLYELVLPYDKKMRSMAGKKGVKAALKYWSNQSPEARSANAVKAGSGNKGIGGACRAPGGSKAMSLKYEDPLHPELGFRSAATLVKMQKARDLPHGPQNRRKVK